jgi:hypothetical protein
MRAVQLVLFISIGLRYAASHDQTRTYHIASTPTLSLAFRLIYAPHIGATLTHHVDETALTDALIGAYTFKG